MKSEIQMVKDTYNNNVVEEWERLERHPIEYAITCRYIDRYIKPGNKVLDIGGGPGRYSLYLAEKGCDITLLELSDANVAFANEQADKQGLQIKTICGDACIADTLVNSQFDHILLMGPLYHLPDENDRIKAVNAALRLLKTDGTLFSAFISSYAAMWDFLAREPKHIISLREQELKQEHSDVLQKWIDFAVNLCEREEFLSMSHHLLHIGRKI